MKKNMTDLEVMKKMVDENKDIRATTTLTDAKKVKQGGKITFGVDEKTFQDVTRSFGLGTQEYYVIAYVVNKKQFEEIKTKTT